MLELKKLKIAGIVFAVLFVVSFSIRIDLFSMLSGKTEPMRITAPDDLPERDTWMNIFQDERKIGFSHSVFKKLDDGYELKETVYMQLNLMGMGQEIRIKTRGKLNANFTMDTMHFEMDSGRFQFSAKGTYTDDQLILETTSGGDTRTVRLDAKNRPFLTAGIVDAVRAAGLEIGESITFPIFDPATMAQDTVTVTVLGKEEFIDMGMEDPLLSTKVEMNFKGSVQYAWIGETGEMLQQEGLLGIRMVKTSSFDALKGTDIEPGRDLTKAASVASNIKISNPGSLTELRVAIQHVNAKKLNITGGRQTVEENRDETVLIVKKETIPESYDTSGALPETFLAATPFVQSDHPDIIKQVNRIIADEDSVPEKIKKIMDWMDNNIEKQPVISVPNALSVLKNRSGDCNEHAVLFASFARAAGIPTAVEAGLVYLKGRFYYHAWNRVYLGNWITVDALFGQFPADVTHLRFAAGEPESQMDIMEILGKIELHIIEAN